MTWLARGAIVGFIFSSSSAILFSTRIFKSWEELHDPPVAALEIVPGPVKAPITEGLSGSFFAYYPDEWILIESQDDLPY